MREGVTDAPALAAAERNAIAVLAEYARRRARLECVWVFSHVAGAEPEAAVRGVARACAPGGERSTSDASARALALQVVAGDRRRFTRGPTTALGRGVHVGVSDRRGRTAAVVVATSSPEEPPIEAVETPIAELADMAGRILADSGPPPEPPVGDLAGGGYGAGLADALAVLERPPILAESRLRVMRAVESGRPPLGELIRTIETDLGLAIAVVSAANRLPGRPRRGVASVPDALTALGPHAVAELAGELPVLRPLAAADRLTAALARMSSHVIATRLAADLVARETHEPATGELRLMAILHDVGKLALAAASDDYARGLADASRPPEERIADERRHLGIDHASVGALAAQRLGLPKRLSAAIEHHHDADADRPAAVLRLADLIAHHAHGDAVKAPALIAAGRALGLEPPAVQQLAYEVARPTEPRGIVTEPSPLSPAQHKVLEGLGRGRTYKQIAAELSLSESTVRSHLHKVYEKLDVADRAQAVLLARERGWI